MLWAERTTTNDDVDEAYTTNVMDSATMMTILHPPKHSALLDCTEEDILIYGTCEDHGYDPQYPNIPLTDLYVSKSEVSDHAGRGVFTNVTIPKGSNIGLETTVYSVVFDWVSLFDGC